MLLQHHQDGREPSGWLVGGRTLGDLRLQVRIGDHHEGRGLAILTGGA